MVLRPVGFVRGGRSEPRDDAWDTEVCEIELDADRFTSETLAGLDSFSHVEVVFPFHLVDEDAVVWTLAISGSVRTGRRSASSLSGGASVPTGSA